MKSRIPLSIMLLLLIVASCSSPKTFENLDPQQKVILNDSDLSDRIKKDNIGVIGIKEAPKENTDDVSEKGLSYSSSDIASNIPLALIAEVSAPVYEGTTLKATHVAINGNYAYVSYNVEGSKYLGAVDVINISDPITPVIELQAILLDTDISSINYYNNALYIAGASNSDEIDEANPAVLLTLKLENGILTDKVGLIDIASYVATDVLANSSGIYGVSGDNGVLAKYKHTSNDLIKSVKINDLRAIR